MANQNLFIPVTQDEKKDYQYEEAMKTLRTNIQFSGSGLKVIMLTSTMPDEGKSETSSQLAISMAQTEGRVLFIDADIRKSVLVSRFGFGQQIYGLTQYLTGQKLLGVFCIIPICQILTSFSLARWRRIRRNCWEKTHLRGWLNGQEMNMTRSSLIRRLLEVSLTQLLFPSAVTELSW